MHTRTNLAVAMLALLLLAPGVARADNVAGFGLLGGVATTVTAGAVVTDTYVDITGHSSAGFSVGVEYQFPLGSVLSLVPFAMSSVEQASTFGTETITANHAIFGVSARVWFGNGFVGLHGGHYDETLNAGGNPIFRGNGPGYGLTAGYESPQHAFVFGQMDRFRINSDDAELDAFGMRFNFGWRL